MLTRDYPDFLQCDVCARHVHRLHECWAPGGLETWACDACSGYDSIAYDEPLDDTVDADFAAYQHRIANSRDH